MDNKKNKGNKKIKKSQRPYKVFSSTIGDIMMAKAANGDGDAQKVVDELMGGKK